MANVISFFLMQLQIMKVEIKCSKQSQMKETILLKLQNALIHMYFPCWSHDRAYALTASNTIRGQ